MDTWHCTWAHLIQIIKVEETAASKCLPAANQLHDSMIKFPLTHRVLHGQ
ncbi:Hypothetical predicted protein [Lynx pardinus]|uniref:Uncharacterized protein n=1 Tax=Lynx pardinus TaxID=191816 RepID=A0A485PAF5_LYNPA|nr:Hypothetical predicted protein [Lynx pardinus]